MALSEIQDGTFRAQVGEHSFDLRFDNGALFLDGAPVAYDFDRISDTYYALRIDGRSVPVVIEPLPDGRLRITGNGRRTDVVLKNEQDLLMERYGLGSGAGTADREVRAPMPGLVLSVLVEPGQPVNEGDGLLVLEAMKMENELRATGDAVVATVHVSPGDAVGKNELLVSFA